MTPKVSVQVKLKIWVIPLIILLSLGLGIIFAYEGWWMIVLAFGLAFLSSYLSIKSLKKNLSVQREMRFGWAKVGDTLEERINIENTGNLGTPWLEVIDQTNISKHSVKIGTNVGPHNRTTWRKKHVCTHRGLYRLGPTTLKTGDLFGFFQLILHDPREAHLLVTPPTIPLPQIEVASGGKTGDVRFTKADLEQSVAVSTIRDYQPLDPLNHIHWPLTAKRNELTTRVFENSPTGNWWILQDMNRAVQVGSERENTLEVGIILSASLAQKGFQSGKAVGLITNDKNRTWIPPQQTSDQSLKILRSLAVAQESDLSLETYLRRSRSNFKQTASIVIVTPDVTPSWWEPLLWLKHKGLIPTILVLDPLSFGSDRSTLSLMNQLRNQGIKSYLIKAEMFADQFDTADKTPWEWREFATGFAVPIKKPVDSSWKEIP